MAELKQVSLANAGLLLSNMYDRHHSTQTDAHT